MIRHYCTLRWQYLLVSIEWLTQSGFLRLDVEAARFPSSDGLGEGKGSDKGNKVCVWTDGVERW